MIDNCYLDKDNIKEFFREIKYKSLGDPTPVVEQAFGFITPQGNVIYTTENNASHHMLAKSIIHNNSNDPHVFDEVSTVMDNDKYLSWEVNEFYSAFLKEQGYVAYRMFSPKSANNIYTYPRLSIKYYKKLKDDQLISIMSWLSCFKNSAEKFSVNIETSNRYIDAVDFLYGEVFSNQNYRGEYEDWTNFYKPYKHQLKALWRGTKR